jgi:site-specific recombinase XerD
VMPHGSHQPARASAYWMRHTHATHALARGAEVTIVRDNLCGDALATLTHGPHATVRISGRLHPG